MIYLKAIGGHIVINLDQFISSTDWDMAIDLDGVIKKI